jgi:predicted DNA-binding transcriptional regulator AlpA
MKPEVRCLSSAQVMEKLARKKSWLWSQLKTNPAFPKPIRLPGAAGRPVWLERDIDEFVMKGINNE